MANKETFCSYPFESLFLETGGTVKPCCSLIGTMGNIKDKPLKEILEGGVAREIRSYVGSLLIFLFVIVAFENFTIS